jgi:hypothetical protein
MLNKLSEKQESMLSVYYNKWVDIGFDTNPVDFYKSVSLIKKHYSDCGLDTPDDFHLVDSPLAAINLLNSKYNIKKSDILKNACFGNHDASWLSYYDYFINETSVTLDKKIVNLIEIAKVCGWWYPYENTVVIQQRPSLINFEDGIVQSTTGPAIQFSDGYSVYIIDGIRLDEQIVMRPETLTIRQIKSEQDQDKRSIMIDRFGWPRFLEESNAKCIDKRDNYIENTKEALFKSDNDNRLVVTCPTGRVFALGVPSSIKTCEDAQSWLGNEEEKVNVIART